MTTERGGNPSVERRTEIAKFTLQDKLYLLRRGFEFFTLYGRTIKSLISDGKPIGTYSTEVRPDFRDVPALRSEVAINPKVLFLPNSNLKTFEQQQELVEKYSQELRARINNPAFKAVIGEAPDYVSLVMAYMKKHKGERLFGTKYNLDFARTKTKRFKGDDYYINVGRFEDDGSLLFDHWKGDWRHFDLHAVPLIVPTA